MRLFFAATLEEHAALAVSELQQSLRRRWHEPGLRWVRQEQLHYTLKFLGEVDSARLPELSGVARSATRATAAFALELSGIGAFPTRRAPRVIWLGAAAGAESLSQLASSLDKGLATIGFEAEQRPFQPHLTLARVKGPAAERVASRLVDAEVVGSVASCRIDSLVLMQSNLSPQGPTYVEVERFRLSDA